MINVISDNQSAQMLMQMNSEPTISLFLFTTFSVAAEIEQFL
jgi:hypothetical protein